MDTILHITDNIRQLQKACIAHPASPLIVTLEDDRVHEEGDGVENKRKQRMFDRFYDFTNPTKKKLWDTPANKSLALEPLQELVEKKYRTFRLGFFETSLTTSHRISAAGLSTCTGIYSWKLRICG